MEDKENSGESANTSSPDEPGNSSRLRNFKSPSGKTGLSQAQGEIEEEICTEDMSLHLELDESATFRETQDSLTGYFPGESKSLQICDKETQEFQMSKSMDEGPFNDESPRAHNSKTMENRQSKNVYNDSNVEISSDINAKGCMKRLPESQGKLFLTTWILAIRFIPIWSPLGFLRLLTTL